MAPPAIKRAAKQIMITGGLRIQAEAQRITPVLIGNLKASAYTAWSPGLGSSGMALTTPFFKSRRGADTGRLTSGHARETAASKGRCGARQSAGGIRVEVGFSAYYALYVHENLQAKHGAARTKPRKGGSGQQAKFLKKAADKIGPSVVSALWTAVEIGFREGMMK